MTGRPCWMSMAALCLALVSLSALPGQLPTEAQKRQTLAYLYSLQQPDGSFASSAPSGKSDLPTTSAAVRAIVYFGGKVPNTESCRKYLLSCQNADGGFAARPGEVSQVRTTALGVLALVELGDADKTRLNRALEYLESQARNFEDIRIAAAAFEAMQVHPREKTLERWRQEILSLRNAEGTFGKGQEVARDSGSVAACLLRLGLPLDNTDTVARAILAGQRQDGGWGRADQPSDLETTYRVMRALYMLKRKPNLDSVARFVASCRSENGGYALRPGESATPQATYFAAAILRWLGNWP